MCSQLLIDVTRRANRSLSVTSIPKTLRVFGTISRYVMCRNEKQKNHHFTFFGWPYIHKCINAGFFFALFLRPSSDHFFPGNEEWREIKLFCDEFNSLPFQARSRLLSCTTLWCAWRRLSSWQWTRRTSWSIPDPTRCVSTTTIRRSVSPARWTFHVRRLRS